MNDYFMPGTVNLSKNRSSAEQMNSDKTSSLQYCLLGSNKFGKPTPKLVVSGLSVMERYNQGNVAGYNLIKCVQRKLDFAGNCIDKQVHCITFVKKQVNLSYSVCHQKR